MGRSHRTHRLAAIVVVGLLTTLAACSSSSATPGSVPAATSTVVLAHNVADAEFAQQMIPHHRQAVAMAELAVDRRAGASPAVEEFADRIKAAQDPEIALMAQWLSDWGLPQPSEPAGTAGVGTMDMPARADPGRTAPGDSTAGASMPGMMSDADMTALSTATGPPFDELWLTMMIRHHRGAITMAQDELHDGTDADVIGLATKIISAQQGEIAQMQQLLGG